jgi:hypothetical protein
MIATPSYIRNAEAVVKAFGYWPSFHDAPVVGFRYDQEGAGAVDLTVHGWEMTADVDERGFFRLIKHHLISFVFLGISDAELDQFDPENILLGLSFSSLEELDADGRFRVTLDSAMGGERCGSFSARSGEIVEVVPCGSDGRKIGPFRPL